MGLGIIGLGTNPWRVGPIQALGLKKYSMSTTQPSLEELETALQSACQPTSAHLIVEGRNKVLAFPREWTLENIESAAVNSLDLGDYWEFRRLLELAELLEEALLQRIVALGLASSDSEVLEAAQDFQR